MQLNRYSQIVTIGLGGLSVLYVLVVFLPAQTRIGELRQEITKKQDFIAQTTRLDEDIRQTDDELTRAETFVRAWQSRSPDPDRLAPLFGSISERLQRSGVKTRRLDPQPPQPMTALVRVPLAIEVHGSFPQLLRMLAALESLPAALWIEQLSVEPHEGDAVRCELSLAVFASKAADSD